jgi:hypothetical protein
MENLGEVKAAFSKLYGFLNTNLSVAQKGGRVFDTIWRRTVVENSEE